MAERSKGYITRLANLLCREYNKINGESYSFDRICDKKELEYDFIINNGHEQIGIQSKSSESSIGYYKGIMQISAIREKLLGRIRLGNLNNVWLILKFKSLPNDNDEIEEFLSNLYIFLINHYRSNSSIISRRIVSADINLLSTIFKYLSEFWYDWNSEPKPIIDFCHDNWHFGGPVGELVDNILDYIKDKDGHYCKTKGILLFEFDPMPLGEIEINELRSRCKSIDFNFSEVWTINLGNEGFCEKIYPWG